MSVLAYPPTNEEEIFRLCTKECGIITATEDQQYFALGCLTCSEKFLYFDAFIEHMQTMHVSYDNDGASTTMGSSSGGIGNMYGHSSNNGDRKGVKRRREDNSEEDLTALLQPSVVMIKEEKLDEDDDVSCCWGMCLFIVCLFAVVVFVCLFGFQGAVIQNEPLDNDDDDYGGYYSVKQEHTDPEMSMDVGDASYMGDSFGSYNDEYTGDDEELEQSNNGDDTNYDDLVEESLLEVSFEKSESI